MDHFPDLCATDHTQCEPDYRPVGLFPTLAEALELAEIVSARTGRKHKVNQPRPMTFTVVDELAFDEYTEWFKAETAKAARYAVPPQAISAVGVPKKPKQSPSRGRSETAKRTFQPAVRLA